MIYLPLCNIPVKTDSNLDLVEFSNKKFVFALYNYCIFFLFYLRRGNRGQSSLRELLQPLVEGVLNDKNLSINTNPLEVYKAWINQMESETGEARYQMLILSAHLLF